MDPNNLFVTPTVYRFMRAEYGVALLVSSYVLVRQADEVNWWHAVLLFAYIDVLGYLPGGLAARRRPGHIPRAYYVLYNTMHSALTAAAVAAAYALMIGPNWALLAIPIHLCVDRCVFGNFAKPFGVTFEPEAHPAYTAMAAAYARSTRPSRASRATGAGTEVTAGLPAGAQHEMAPSR